MQHHSWVYIMASSSGVLYIGVTSDIEGRVWEHKMKVTKGFSRQYNTTLLVYVEDYDDITDAIAREKQLKGWSRAKKVAVIERDNPHWLDLTQDW